MPIECLTLSSSNQSKDSIDSIVDVDYKFLALGGDRHIHVDKKTKVS